MGFWVYLGGIYLIFMDQMYISLHLPDFLWEM